MAERKSKGKNALWLLLLLGGAGALVAASAGKKTTTPSVTHKECVGGFCQDVEGVGPDLCTLDDDCIVPPATHKECQGNNCVNVLGAGADLCSQDGDCVVATHKECSGGFCLDVAGAGADLCSLDAECVPLVPKHLECQGGVCTVVEGEGADQCATHDDCAGPTPTHKECAGGVCVDVNGAGADLCSVDEECFVPPATHRECQSGNCVIIDGEGIDECTVDGDCPQGVTHKECQSGVCTDIPGTDFDHCDDANINLFYHCQPANHPVKAFLKIVSVSGLLVKGEVSFTGGVAPHEVLILKGDGGGGTFPGAGTWQWSYGEAGTYDISLVVKDANGFGGTDHALAVEVGGSYVPIVCSATLVSNLDGVVTIEVNASEGVPPFNFFIIWGDETADIVAEPGQYSHQYAASGQYDVRVEVQDEALSNCIAEINDITVTAPPPLLCNLTLVQNQNLSVTVNASFNGGASPYSAAILWGDGFMTSIVQPGQYSHTYSSPKTVNIDLLVTDSKGVKCSNTIQDVIIGGAGGGALSCTFTFLSKNGLTANFDIDVQGGSPPYNIAVEWGDGKQSTDLSIGAISHTYATSGKKQPLLVVGNDGTDYPDGDCFDLTIITL